MVFYQRFLKGVVLVNWPKGPTLVCVLVQDRQSPPRQDWSNRRWLEEMVKAILAPLIAWIYWSLTCQEGPKGCDCYRGRSDGSNKKLHRYILSIDTGLWLLSLAKNILTTSKIVLLQQSLDKGWAWRLEKIRLMRKVTYTWWSHKHIQGELWNCCQEFKPPLCEGGY